MTDLQPQQFGGGKAESAQDFAGQMREYRNANPGHAGVQQYHETAKNGFMAHVEGLVHHAYSVDSFGKFGRTVNDSKLADAENNYDPGYVSDLRDAIRSGDVDPIHVAMGHEMVNQGFRYSKNAAGRPNDPWIGNGNHRLALAHDAGVKRIPAKRSHSGTGDDGYGAEFKGDNGRVHEGDSGYYEPGYSDEYRSSSEQPSMSYPSGEHTGKTPNPTDYTAWKAHVDEHIHRGARWPAAMPHQDANSWVHGGNAVRSQGLYTELHGGNRNISPHQFGGEMPGQQALDLRRADEPSSGAKNNIAQKYEDAGYGHASVMRGRLDNYYKYGG